MSDLEWGQVVEGWRLSLSLDKSEFSTREPVMATLLTQNARDEPLPLPVHSQWTTFEFNVQDQTGAIPLTRFGKRMEENKLTSGHGNTEIPPNDSLTLELQLDRIVDLTISGNYTVTASRAVIRQGTVSEIALISNEVKFDIVEDE